jgi:hypothetical protein
MTETRSVVIERENPHPPEKIWRGPVDGRRAIQKRALPARTFQVE